MSLLRLEYRFQLGVLKGVKGFPPRKTFYTCITRNCCPLAGGGTKHPTLKRNFAPSWVHSKWRGNNWKHYRSEGSSNLPKSPIILAFAAVGVQESSELDDLSKDAFADRFVDHGGDHELEAQRRITAGDTVSDEKSLTLIESLLEPLKTCLRFVQLTVLFLPVILSFPLVLFGPRLSSMRFKRKGAVVWYRYLTWTMELAGPSFIKWAASRTDIFSELLCHELSKLHSSSSPHPLKKTVRILEKTFNCPFDEIFDEFIEEPLGVGAMGQVYKAKLSKKIIEQAESEPVLTSKSEDQRLRKRLQKRMKSSKFVDRFTVKYQEPPSDWVIVKVLHPRVRKMVRRDLSIMGFFANVINALPTMEWLSFPQEVQMFGHMMNMQLNLLVEAENLLIFRENFKDRVDINFPKPFFRLCSRDILVEEYINGISMSTLLRNTDNTKLQKHVNGKEAHDENPMVKEISDKGLDAFLKMLLLDNFIHSDLHPGNIYIRFYKKDRPGLLRPDKNPNASHELDAVTEHLLKLKDNKEAWNNELQEMYAQGYKPQICFIDAGLVTELNNVNRTNFIDLFKAIATFDGYHVGELMVERSRTPSTVTNEDIFIFKVDRLIRTIKHRTFALGNVQIGDLLTRMLSMVRDHHVRLEGDFITVVISVLLLEGIGRQLNPDMDLFKSSIPILRQLGPDYTHNLFSEDSLSMAKVWLTLELRRFITASIQDVHGLVKYDGLCPNQ